MKDETDIAFAASLRNLAQPLEGAATDYDALLAFIGDARIVLIGEASHGTHEFYRERAVITQRLIAEKGFTVVAVEADWPDAYRVNRWVRGASPDEDAVDALAGFQRFPTWMWRNADVLDFVGWLREHNDGLAAEQSKTGFYGLDLYSLRTSMQAVIDYLERADPEAAQRAKARYSCFDQFSTDLESYALAVGANLSEPCEKEAISQLVELLQQRARYLQPDGGVAVDEFFYAEQNARIVKNAERYYRTMIGAGISSWNLRDAHMTETLQRLLAHLDRGTADTKAVVWAHNSHIGDARATDMSLRHETNVGELVRSAHGNQVVLIGQTTYAGTVTAATDWNGPAEPKRVRPGLAQSIESVLHFTGIPRFYLELRSQVQHEALLREPRLERFIGVIYRPETERQSHYYRAVVSDQFDALLHFDHSRAVEPLERTATWAVPEVPETFPTGV
jgi:erythromycin esterase-like protein